ncbi:MULTISPECIES: OmpA family protein [unclassified Methylophaga]|nr:MULTISPECIES: OmpA family protein [unclassified Methylophaga]
MRNAFIERDKIKKVAVAYQDTQVAIYDALMGEFDNDIDKWNAEIDKETITFTFKSPDVLFENGEIALKEEYKYILSDFFPRYMETLDKFSESINEVRIEGHTSSIWNNAVSNNEAYFLNMELSQGRTRSVLDYVYNLTELEDKYKPWIKQNIAAVGLSSSRAIYENGVENEDKSRRVTFRVITNADIRIKQILEVDA